MSKKIIFSLLILIVAGAAILLGRSDENIGEFDENITTHFRDELSRAGVERVGQPIEGFSAFMYLDAFPGFEEVDFDGVQSYEGIYKFAAEELQYERTGSQPVTSAEDVISDSGYGTLLKNFSKRVNVDVGSKNDISKVLEKLREGDVELSSYISDDFSIWHPEGWFSYENNGSVFFSKDENLNIPANTDGFALAPWFQVGVDVISVEELFDQNLWNDGSEFLVSKDEVLINGLEGFKIVTQAAGAGGEVLHYVFNPDERVFTLSMYPFERGSKDTDEFEQSVATFMPNYEPGRNPTSADNAPSGSIHNLPVPEAVSEVKRFVATDENISEGLVIVMTAYEKTWTNGCLDLAEVDEMCTEALVQGYEVSVQGAGDVRVFHTNGNGSQIREMICPGPNCNLDKNIPF
jgi:hypothetical protein